MLLIGDLEELTLTTASTDVKVSPSSPSVMSLFSSPAIPSFCITKILSEIEASTSLPVSVPEPIDMLVIASPDSVINRSNSTSDIERALPARDNSADTAAILSTFPEMLPRSVTSLPSTSLRSEYSLSVLLNRTRPPAIVRVASGVPISSVVVIEPYAVTTSFVVSSTMVTRLSTVNAIPTAAGFLS